MSTVFQFLAFVAHLSAAIPTGEVGVAAEELPTQPSGQSALLWHHPDEAVAQCFQEECESTNRDAASFWLQFRAKQIHAAAVPETRVQGAEMLEAASGYTAGGAELASGLAHVAANMSADPGDEDVIEDEDDEEVVINGVSVACSRDTGGSCMFFPCSSSRGEVECAKRRCVCKEGFCNNHGACVPRDGQRDLPKCHRRTGHTCRFFACNGWLGPTKCKHHRCLCKPGYCSVDGTCYENRGGSFTARVAPVTQDRPAFPKPQDEVVSALAFSGGGGRALSFSLGVMRALHGMGLLGGDNIDAISSVSGGSWAAAIYMFSNMSLARLLGGPTDPAYLTMDVLEQTPPALGAAATTSTTNLCAKMLFAGVDARQLWVNVVSDTFLKPFGLGGLDSYMAASEEDVARIKRDNPQLENARFLTPVSGRPKTFVMTGTLLAPVGYEASKKNAVSLQMSPDYIGSPFYPGDGTVSYRTESGRSNDLLSDVIVGGGMVESFAFGGLSPRTDQSGGLHVTLPASVEPFSLAKAVAVSSAGPSTALTQYGPHGVVNVAKLAPRSNYWAVTSGQLPGPQKANTYTLGDGGNLDNSGVPALLQRGARRIVSVINTGSSLPKDVDLCSLTVLDHDVAKHLENQLQSLFGFWHVDDVGEFLSNNQVFKSEDLLPILCTLQGLRDDGKPAVMSKTLTVLANDWWGIKGGYEATFILVYVDTCTDFEHQLPSETQVEILKGFMGAFHRFPHYLPVFQNIGEATALTNAQVNLLAAQAEYSVRQNKLLFEKLFDFARSERGQR